MNTKSEKPNSDETDQPAKLPACGIIMPIAAMPDYEKSHWDRVRIILNEAIEQAGYKPRLVSESEDIGVIHARIVQNLYDDPIVVCDVSGKNANVMFELGLRLAFDKPTIIIKDYETSYSFDTSPIEHINYRADLRFDDVREFKRKLSGAISACVARKEKDETYSPFLGHFGKFKVTGLETKEIESAQFIVDQIQELRGEVGRLSQQMDYPISDALRKTILLTEPQSAQESELNELKKQMRLAILRKTGKYVPDPTLDLYLSVVEERDH